MARSAAPASDGRRAFPAVFSVIRSIGRRDLGATTASAHLFGAAQLRKVGRHVARCSLVVGDYGRCSLPAARQGDAQGKAVPSLWI